PSPSTGSRRTFAPACLLRLLVLGVDRVLRSEHRLLRVRLVALQVLLPVGLPDHELLEPELVRPDRAAHLQLVEDDRAPLRQPARRILRPPVPERRVGRELARVIPFLARPE